MENPDSKPTGSPPSSLPKEPESKKLKMSSTATTSDDEDTTRKQRYKRRKIAIFFAYCGVGYQGMQKNPGAKTIESDLEEALFQSGAVSEQDRNNPKRYDWARSARTDKGVSAVGQVVSGRFYIDPPGFVERLNSNLASQIRIFGFKRVTGSFNAKKFCDRRRYVYLIPVFALDPSSHRDRESVMASLGSGSELVKCLECSERGRKVVGIMGRRYFEAKAVSVESGISSNSGEFKVESEVKEDSNVSLENGDNDKLNSESIVEPRVLEDNGASEIAVETLSVGLGVSSNIGDAAVESDVKEEIMVSSDTADNDKSNSESIEEPKVADDNGASEIVVETVLSAPNAGTNEKVKGEEKGANGSGFHYGEKERERFNRILKYYVGSHNFHNFTTRTKAEDPAARRFIISFDANTVVTVEGSEFVKCEVVGQSFMLHQIRKMIGLAVAIMRNFAPESLLEKALQKDVNINVPTAPEVGLYLEECFFTSYNQKWKDTHEEVSMKAYEEEAEEFKMKQIYSHIASTEHKEGSVALWLHSLNHRNYPDLLVNNVDTTNVKSAEGENMAD